MKGKNYSIPYGMVFKKYYCSKCGMKLEKERTHRVVSKDDKDYYQYHDHGMFPRSDHDVYDYRFKCPYCNTRISFEEQCIIERIQKKCNSKTLSTFEIKENYDECKTKENIRILIRNILVPLIFISIFFTLFYFFGENREAYSLVVLFVLYVIMALGIVVGAIRRYKGNYKMRRYQTYSHEEEAQLKRLHAYSSNNKDLIITSETCYCFYCKEKFNSKEIKEYIDNGKTALCPKCGVDSVLPDTIEGIDDRVIDEMNRYWF